jgi:hypothetical protein
MQKKQDREKAKRSIINQQIDKRDKIVMYRSLHPYLTLDDTELEFGPTKISNIFTRAPKN